jgi:hypothetical protein
MGLILAAGLTLASVAHTLATKKPELRREFSKEKPDRQHMDTLQKESIDIRTHILKEADEAGLMVRKEGSVGCGRVLGKDIMGRCPVNL